MSYFIDDYRYYFLEATQSRTSKKVEIPSIKEVLKSQAGKKGKPSVEKQLFEKLKHDYSDVAIYVALALARTEVIHMAADDILAEIESKMLIPNEYHKYIEKGGDKAMSDAQKKNMAMKIWNAIIEGEARSNKEILAQLASKRSGGKLAHELSNEQLLEIYKAIISGLRILDMVKEHDASVKSGDDLLNFEKDSHMSTSFFINDLCKSILSEIKRLEKSVEFGPKIVSRINEINKILSSQALIWPESDYAIQSTEELEKYFKELTSKQERMRGEKIIQSYSKKYKGESESELEETLDDVITDVVNDLENEDQTDFERIGRIMHERAREIISQHPELIELLAPENDEEAPMMAEIELEAEISKALKQRYGHIGRRKKSWQKDEESE